MRIKLFKLSIMAIGLVAVWVLAPSRSEMRRAEGSTFVHEQSGLTCCGYWAAIELHNGLTTYSASNVFRSQSCEIANDHVWKYVESIIGHKEKGGAFTLYCKASRQEIEDKIRAPASYHLVTLWSIPDDPLIGGDPSGSAGNTASSETETTQPYTSEADENERAKERARAYESQKAGARVNPNGSVGGNSEQINPNGSRSEEVVQREGESDEDFRARQRAAEYERQKQEERKTVRRPICSVDRTSCIRILSTKYNSDQSIKSITVTWKNICSEKLDVAVCYVNPYEDCATGHGCSHAFMTPQEVVPDEFPLPKPPLYPLSRNFVIRAVKAEGDNCGQYLTNCPNRPRR